MKFLSTLFNLYLQSSIHVALAVTSIALITIFEYGFVPEPTLFIFILLGGIVSYNFVKYAGVSNQHNLTITSHITLIRIFTVICFIGFIYFGWFLPIDVLFTAAGFGSLTLLYAVPVFMKKNLRSLPGLKIFIIAAVWMGITVFLPLEYHNIRFSERVLYQSLEIFLFVIALTLPFEIRDLKYDELELKTIPQRFGVWNTKWFGTALLLISAFLAIQQNYIEELQLYCSLLIYLITLAFLWFSKVEQGRYYAAFWVEGIPGLWFLFYILI